MQSDEYDWSKLKVTHCDQQVDLDRMNCAHSSLRRHSYRIEGHGQVYFSHFSLSQGYARRHKLPYTNPVPVPGIHLSNECVDRLLDQAYLLQYEGD